MMIKTLLQAIGPKYRIPFRLEEQPLRYSAGATPVRTGLKEPSGRHRKDRWAGCYSIAQFLPHPLKIAGFIRLRKVGEWFWPDS
jgi:hypothetical protein